MANYLWDNNGGDGDINNGNNWVDMSSGTHGTVPTGGGDSAYFGSGSDSRASNANATCSADWLTPGRIQIDGGTYGYTGTINFNGYNVSSHILGLYVSSNVGSATLNLGSGSCDVATGET